MKQPEPTMYHFTKFLSEFEAKFNKDMGLIGHVYLRGLGMTQPERVTFSLARYTQRP